MHGVPEHAVPKPPPDDSPVLAFLRRLHAKHVTAREGSVATYIPELAHADPEAFGIVIATVDGALYEVGDTRIPFTIQSMSKPLTYAAILDRHGETAIRRRIGVEPTGDAFNAITLETGAGTPLNPMVNAGAIAAVGLVDGDDSATRSKVLLDTVARFAGRPLEVDEAVYRSERDTGHRNRAIAHLLRSTGALDGDPDEVADAYFRQCSIAVDTRDLALIAATLANAGRQPVSGMRAASESTVRDVLSVMATCGMYDGAGEWLFDVGLPAKSGVSGGILAVLPGRLGIGVWSPRLDDHGNSVRGVAICRDLASELDLHLVRGLRDAGPIRTRTTAAAHPSKRFRSPTERARLSAEAGRSLVLELQGDLTFVAAERVVREALPEAPSPLAVVLDLRRVGRVDAVVSEVLADLVAALGTRGAAVAWTGVAAHAAILDQVDGTLQARRLAPPVRLPDLDLGLEWAEEVVLARLDSPATHARPVNHHVSLDHHPALDGLDGNAAALLAASMQRRHWSAGDIIIRRGDPADSLLLITGGRLSVWVPLGGSEARRIATLEAGMMVGELSFLGRERRTADVEADTDVEAWVLDVDAFDRLAEQQPQITAAFLRTLLRIVAGIARRMTDEVALLAS
jgi:glutaminase